MGVAWIWNVGCWPILRIPNGLPGCELITVDLIPVLLSVSAELPCITGSAIGRSDVKTGKSSRWDDK